MHNFYTMNIKFSGNLVIKSGLTSRHPRGYASEAAKAAFDDIRSDEDMKVRIDTCGTEFKASIILNECILDVDMDVYDSNDSW